MSSSDEGQLSIDDIDLDGLSSDDLSGGDVSIDDLGADLGVVDEFSSGGFSSSSIVASSSNKTTASGLPEVIKNFFGYFYRHLSSKNVFELHAIYENSLPTLTEQFYARAAWPKASVVAPLVEENDIFLMLYKEFYFKHVHSRLKPSIQDRLDAWENYSALFEFLLNAKKVPQNIELPTQWIWNLIDEFVYQFQEFCEFRNRSKNLTDDELALLKKDSQIWSVQKVFSYLYRLIQKSNIVQVLAAEKENQSSDAVKQLAGPFGARNLYRMLGYFSIIGMCRVHCLLGDYHMALKTLEPIEFNKKGLFTRTASCHVTLYYYLGFAYMMTRRYIDAIKSFSTILLFISRSKGHQLRAYQYDQIAKRHDKLYALLAITVTLCPQRIDEQVHSALREKYGEKMQRMQLGESAPFEEIFSFACPKFVNPAIPDYSQQSQKNQEKNALHAQLSTFMNEVKQQLLLPTIRSYLKLYTTIDLEKLANFLDIDQSTLINHLLCIKHKTHSVRWHSGLAPLDGVPTTATDIRFYIDNDMIHIMSNKGPRRYSDYYIRHIHKFEHVISSLRK
mmetsp:Transcript_20006/g.29749  ORF Transcript_20006/g.29749 Transcript_20006/m.29749 type:complete len:561 (-) Transcript_20006:26-1708(-)|eukprot:CAMPEP_0201545520 /NCGR_PEP_ID=MMETSP0173_2-20130828/2012_1 /ASSEMBLY_ACC=CAM_ASM_000268 /TAXON_ID=218659 /ORGANISM="Vexillifera sp., Strain DIVA3 564/2" /LENGTH=560 /DNA_ID=CAMNT_0047953935 /DNA_START=58 /DNA_END=1740 /DNA_ORIENTATION=+